MKKQFIVISLLLAAMLLSACGAASETTAPAEEEAAVETAVPVETAAEPAPTEEPVAAEEPAADEHAASEETPAAPQQEPASAQQPETSTPSTAPSSGGTSGGGGNSTTPIIGVIGSGGQSSGGADQPQSSSGVVGVIGGQQTHVHSYSRQVVVPTCSEGGYTIFTCSCGESYTGNYTSATGQHRWVMDYDYVPVYEERAICVCNVCGKDVTDITLKEHYFNDGCPGGWHSETLRVEVGTSYEVVGCHCGDCGKVAGE